MKYSMKLSLALVLGISSSVGLCSNDKAKPNVVLFLFDDMGWKDLGVYGAEIYETPNIDQLAEDGCRFTQAYTSALICSPARASIMTGKHPLKLEMWNHLQTIKKKDATDLLPQLLSDAGYSTWHVGKWHMGNPKDQTMPTDLGFQKNIGGWISWGPGSYFWPYNWKEEGGSMGHPNDCIPLREGGQEGEQITDRLTREAISLIKNRAKDKPFFLNFWYYSVHNRKEAKSELIRKYENKIKDAGLKPTYRKHQYTGDSIVTSETNAVYAAMLETVDNSVGEVVKLLKAIGEYENTLFIFYSDNGPTTNDVPCTPLMGGKNTTYEAGVRMPAFFTWKTEIESGTVSNDRIIIMDIYNTVLEASNIDIPEGYHGDGVSLISHFHGKSVPDRDFYWYFPWNRPMYAGRSSAALLDKNGMKYIHFFEGDHPELYNLNVDMAEENDLIRNHSKKGEHMAQKLAHYLDEVGISRMKKQLAKE
ncbi:hypothetical protein EYV94_00715 [Puteibacter caeruleilacunae]|nr:hypothetical protein EYV94_00715 [Puteibacter caeruleilacunae]